MLYQRKIARPELLSTKLEFQLQHSRFALIGAQLVGVAASLFLLWFQLPVEMMLTWGTAMFTVVLVYALRIGSALESERYRTQQSKVYAELWLGALLLGLSWSVSVLWADSRLSDQYFYVFVSIGIIACVATIAVSSIIREVYLAQVIGALLPIASWLAWHYDARPFNLVMGGLIIGFAVLMSLVSGWMSRSFGHMVESSLERDAMTRDLAELSDSLRLRNLQLQEARKQLSDIATIDELTGLRNRRGANQVFETEISRAKRAGIPLAIIMLDVDHFKLYNDTYGHPAGDVVLQRVAEVLLSVTSRAGELAVRMGGEEFMLILPGSSQGDALGTAEAIKSRVMELAIAHSASPSGDILTVSQGVVSCVPRLQTEMGDLVEAADKALYQSKSSGRNQISLSPFSP